jgi:YebC/PmpR family DNA-binding regulatory protein
MMEWSIMANIGRRSFLRAQPHALASVAAFLNAGVTLFPPPPSRRWAGHSKWANIRHKKGAKDKVRAAILGKASLGIMAASKACSGDLSNLRLQSAIAHAKSVQLPKDRIEDAIAKGTISKGSGDADLLNLRYDAMLNMGGTKVACLVLALSDNRNRTASSVRHLVTKDGAGELMSTDSLAYVFDLVGQITVENVEDEDALLECALEAGALNMEPNDEGLPDDEKNDDSSNTIDQFVVTTEDTELFQVVNCLRDGGYNVTQFDHRYVLTDQEHGGVELSSEGEDALIQFLDKMDENEDVTNVFHNAV